MRCRQNGRSRGDPNFFFSSPERQRLSIHIINTCARTMIYECVYAIRILLLWRCSPKTVWNVQVISEVYILHTCFHIRGGKTWVRVCAVFLTLMAGGTAASVKIYVLFNQKSDPSPILPYNFCLISENRISPPPSSSLFLYHTNPHSLFSSIDICIF
jgi:hypothetical protein